MYRQDMNSGYSGFSMSLHAIEAYENGEMPISKWKKSDIMEAVEEILETDHLLIDAIKKRKKDTIKAYLLIQSSWHHTSKFCNFTPFYKINKTYLLGLTIEKVMAWIDDPEEREKKMQQDEDEREERFITHSTAEAYDLYLELKEYGEKSRSGNFYHWGRKPSHYDYDDLNSFFHEGETRIHTDTEEERYVLQRWHDGEWVDIC